MPSKPSTEFQPPGSIPPQPTAISPFYLAGATGTGKSHVALDLAERLGGEIVNADAYQIYRGLDILTAKPAAKDLTRVSHHLYSALDPGESLDASRFAALAKPVIAEIQSRGRLPIVTGGSGLYLKALTHGISENLPPSDPTLRAELEAQPLPLLAHRLHQLDPDGAAKTNLLNKRYVIRALEITLLSGRPMSEIKNGWASQNPTDFRGVVLVRERADLYERINARVSEMFDSGALEEVRAAETRSRTSAKAIGVGEIRAHLAGELTLDACIDAVRQSTRRYAKRQMTWFRREIGFVPVCLAPDDGPDSAIARILEHFPELAVLS
jgi:tRNA dimethylallyltransferase